MLEIENLTVGYNDLQVLDGVSLHVNVGEIVTIVGSNGAGKTTLVKAIVGLVPVKEGKVIFLGENLASIPAHDVVKKGIVLVPEGRWIFAKMSVEQNLNLGGYLVKEKAQILKRKKTVYDLFPRLKERKNQMCGTLSGGEQGMVAIGRALMASPKLLVLDEPSIGLSPLLVELTMDTIKHLNIGGLTIMLVEQNVREALELSSRAYVLQSGKFVSEGTGNELLNSELVKKAYLGI